MGVEGFPKTALQKHLAICEALSLANGMKIVGRNFGISQSASSGTADNGGTSRFAFTPAGAISKLGCLLTSEAASAATYGNSEASGESIINKVYYEYAGASIPDSKNGKTVIINDPASSVTQTDGAGIVIPAQTPFFVRYYQTFAFLPSGTPTATAIAGGSLASGFARYYVVTAVRNGIESSPTEVFSVTPSGSNLSVLIAIVDTKSASADYYNVYESAAAGGTKQYVGQTVGKTKRFIDDGSYTPDSTINPPAAGKKYKLNRIMAKVGDCSSHIAAGQAGGDFASGTGTFNAYGPSFIFGSTPFCIVGDDRSGLATLVFGDSIWCGRGFGAETGFYPQERGMWEAAFNDGEINSLNWSFGGATLCEMLHPTTSGGGRSRLKLIPYADRVIDGLGINDFGAGRTWQQWAADKLLLASICAKFKVPYYLSTILPKVTTTNGCVTIAGQTPISGTERTNGNLWVRAGCPVNSSGVADMSGNPSPLVKGFIELCSGVEANSSNVLTLNGGYWKSPSTPITTGLVLNGTPTATSLPITTSLTVNENLGRVIKITSGARNGQYCIVKSNTTSAFTVFASGSTALAGIAAFGLAGAPAAGDTFDLYEAPAGDGLHPSLSSHTSISAVIRAWLLANVINA